MNILFVDNACAVISLQIFISISSILQRSNLQRLTSQDSDDLWEYVLRVYAVFIYRSILRLKVACLFVEFVYSVAFWVSKFSFFLKLKGNVFFCIFHVELGPPPPITGLQGMWVKTGQYIGSRSDVMPQPIIDEFVKLQVPKMCVVSICLNVLVWCILLLVPMRVFYCEFLRLLLAMLFCVWLQHQTFWCGPPKRFVFHWSTTFFVHRVSPKGNMCIVGSVWWYILFWIGRLCLCRTHPNPNAITAPDVHFCVCHLNFFVFHFISTIFCGEDIWNTYFVLFCISSANLTFFC